MMMIKKNYEYCFFALNLIKRKKKLKEKYWIFWNFLFFMVVKFKKKEINNKLLEDYN